MLAVTVPSGAAGAAGSMHSGGSWSQQQRDDAVARAGGDERGESREHLRSKLGRR